MDGEVILGMDKKLVSMLKTVALKNFKCFQEETELNLAPITIMYGKNGRGKSTVAQSLLLLAQTMVESNDISNLLLTGRYVSLGTFADILSSASDKSHFSISLKNDEGEMVEMRFTELPNKPQMAAIGLLKVNEVSRFEKVSSESSDVESEKKTLSTTSDIKTLQMLKSARYVSAGRLGPQNSIVRKDSIADDDLGVNGENLLNVLSRKGIDFLEEVEIALGEILDGAAMRINYKDSERIELFLNSKDGKETFRPVNVGFGYSYVLPVIVAALLAQKDSLLIVENPEAHLHPAAQSRIMKFLIRVAKEKNLQLVIETHSDHVVNGMRIAIKEGVLNTREAHVLYFSNEECQVKMITCDKNGTLSDYPDDFLDEWTLQMLKLV